MFKPKFSITNRTANALTDVERARGFLEAATLSSEWLAKMQNQILVREAHYTTHIEGTQLTLAQSQQLWDGIILTKNITHIHDLPKVLDEEASKLTPYATEVFKKLYQQFQQYDQEVDEYNKRINDNL